MRTSSFLDGAKAALPAGLGCIPVGISIGLLASQAGLTELEGIVMSVLVMAGASELMALQMMTSGASAITIIVGTFLVNLRHLVMSSSVWSRIRDASLAQRLVGSFALCDESFAVFSLSSDHSYECLLGANTLMFTFFVASTAVGCCLTGVLPEIVIDAFGIAFYAAFLGLLLPSVKGSRRLLALVALTALLNGVLGQVLPSSWSIIVSMVAGAAAGVFLVPDEDVMEEDAAEGTSASDATEEATR